VEPGEGVFGEALLGHEQGQALPAAPGRGRAFDGGAGGSSLLSACGPLLHASTRSARRCARRGRRRPLHGIALKTSPSSTSPHPSSREPLSKLHAPVQGARKYAWAHQAARCQSERRLAQIPFAFPTLHPRDAAAPEGDAGARGGAEDRLCNVVVRLRRSAGDADARVEPDRIVGGARVTLNEMLALLVEMPGCARGRASRGCAAYVGGYEHGQGVAGLCAEGDAEGGSRPR
jgi:hypothetical protein